MSDDVTLLLKLIAAKTTVRSLVGTFVSASATGCEVDVGNGRVPARFGTGYLPEVNETVNVLFIDDDVFVMGPTTTKAPRGTVVSVAASLVTLDTDYGPVTAPYGGDPPATGQVMALRWHGGPFAMGVASTTPPAPVPPEPPAASTTPHVDTFQAIDAGSFNRYGWQQAQVWASDSYQGAWFYGTKIPDTIPASASIQKVEIYLSPTQIRFAPPNFALHAHPTKPGGAPTYGVEQAVGAAEGWLTLPTQWGDYLKAGGGSFGVGVDHGGYSIFRSLSQDGMSGALRISSTY
ncbi:hypothetical protein HP467_07195 [Curtobacterium albidum]|uniref:Uncharacterized protein n=1 Tax=Curtobacterium citreum TaxID=2036 RepID=A0A850DQW0_9MICO|nr:hypothetical protein [Curtobacterium albidum]NUU27897.1 hypothetical protein [Curtobacterium albidum]